MIGSHLFNIGPPKNLSDGKEFEVSVLIPCLNEVENVEALVQAIEAELSGCGAHHEFIFIDNGSTDGTIELIKKICGKKANVRLIVNNRNFGQMRSPTYGIYQTSGRCVLGIGADFQDPPALIPELVARWRGGAKIVLAVRQSEDMTLVLRVMRAVGYGILARFGDYRVVPGATGFGIYDREVVDCLRKWRDPEPFFRGMLVESGYSLETVPYDRPPRAGGRSKNNLLTLFGLFMVGLASSAKGLLRLPLYVSMIIFGLSILTFGCAIADFVLGRSVGAILVGVAIEIGFALIFLFLGLLGEQVRLISEMTRNVPLVTEKERVNFPD